MKITPFERREHCMAWGSINLLGLPTYGRLFWWALYVDFRNHLKNLLFFSHLLLVINSSTNMILYIFLNKAFRMHFVKMLKRVVLRVRLPCRLTVVSTVPTKLLKAHLCAHISRIFSVCPLCRRHIYLGIYKVKKIDLGSCFNWIVHAQRMEFIGTDN